MTRTQEFKNWIANPKREGRELTRDDLIQETVANETMVRRKWFYDIHTGTYIPRYSARVGKDWIRISPNTPTGKAAVAAFAKDTRGPGAVR